MIGSQTVVSTTPETTVADAARLMKQSGVGTMLVVEKEQLVGIFTERDALISVVAAGRDAKSTRLAEVMTRNPQTIHPDKPFGHALHMMYEAGYRHVPVVEDGRLIGMVSARDALLPEMQLFESELRFREEITELLA
jgi:CBS domain-containing protein